MSYTRYIHKNMPQTRCETYGKYELEPLQLFALPSMSFLILLYRSSQVCFLLLSKEQELVLKHVLIPDFLFYFFIP